MEKSKIFLILLVAVFAMTIGAGLRAAINPIEKIELADKSNARLVTLASISELFGNNSPLSLVGSVTSKNEVNIRSQAQGRITAVYKDQGDFVSSGQKIAQLENTAQSAALIQAQGVLDTARASLDKAKKGTRNQTLAIIKANLTGAENSLAETQISAINNIQNAFASADDAVRNRIDTFMSPSLEGTQKVIFPTPNSQLKTNLEWQRQLIESSLNDWASLLNNLKGNNLINAMSLADDNLNQIRSFLDKAAVEINQINPSNQTPVSLLSGWKASIITARAEINGALSAISGARNGINQATTGLEVAKQQYDQGTEGLEKEDISVAEAMLKQALGTYQFALDNLNKTSIVTPISGTLNSFDLEIGDFISMTQSVAVVSNNNTLEIITFITEQDKDRIRVGSEVIIDKKYQGTVTEVAPAIDQKTKKIEVRIAISNTDLINGQSVRIEISRSVKATEISDKVSVPLSAIKINTDSTQIFSINEDNELVAHDVVLGSIIGSDIIIEHNLDPNTKIVLDARGLKAGQKVEVK